MQAAPDGLQILARIFPASLKAGAINDRCPIIDNAPADINLQALTNIFIADEREFNAAAYAVFRLLAAVLIVAVVRTNAGREMNYLTIGALSALTLMPVYHPAITMP